MDGYGWVWMGDITIAIYWISGSDDADLDTKRGVHFFLRLDFMMDGLDTQGLLFGFAEFGGYVEIRITCVMSAYIIDIIN